MDEEKDSENIQDISNCSFFEKKEIDDVELGVDYPVYGMITKIINDDPANFIVEINYAIKTKIQLVGRLSTEEEVNEKANIVKGRAFEPGLFVLKFSKVDYEGKIESGKYPIEADCTGVVFGKQTAGLHPEIPN